MQGTAGTVTAGPSGPIPAAGGVVIVPPPVGPYDPTFVWPQLDPAIMTSYYFLGDRMARYSTSAFLIIESQSGSDYFNSNGTGTSPALDAGSTYTANGGLFAFRHGQLTRANYLFFDARVETLGRLDPLLKRWTSRPN